MSRLFYHTMQDNAGNLLFDVSGTMRIAGTGTLATIYGDEALTVILPNPMTNHPSYGSFKCFLPSGDFDFYMAKSGYTFETLTGVQGLGTMAQQDAGAVGITGGTAQVSALGVGQAPGANGLVVVNGTSYFGQPIGLGIAAETNVSMKTAYNRASGQGFFLVPSADTGPGNAVLFVNVSLGAVGAITTTSTATAYSTTSDARLKHAIAPLTGELEVVQALRPVSFLWNADNSPGHGFIASEVAAHVQGVITGEADAVDEDGHVRPQMIDMSKLVPFLVGAVQTLAARLEGMEARLHVLEDALGI